MGKKELIILLIIIFMPLSLMADTIPVFEVFELEFRGSYFSSKDNPVRDIDLITTWQNESGNKMFTVYGFFDGDGNGSPAGNVFKVRFCPVTEGVWVLTGVRSNDRKLDNQHKGFSIKAVRSENHGFWETDFDSRGARWYKRSDNSHQYITGNTMYSFLSEYDAKVPSQGSIAADVGNNSQWFKKIRIGITGDRYPNPDSKPFLTDKGDLTDDGNYSYRPNPEWFLNRVDKAVIEAGKKDLITDLILNGPDTPESRSSLKPQHNNLDPSPYLKYIAARYGSFPNVWICLSNEYNIKTPSYSAAEIINAGNITRTLLPYSTPLSVHAAPDEWDSQLNTSGKWFDHVTIQSKLKKLDQSADAIGLNYFLGGSSQPVINDELAYEGEGDGWSEEDVIEAFLGAFAGGGYGSTGYKTGNKTGHYFTGNFNPQEHKASDNLKWFREIIDNNITFWKMAPVPVTGNLQAGKNIFRNIDTRFRIMANENSEYLIAGNYGRKQVMALLPEGTWVVKSYDLVRMKEELLSTEAAGTFVFNFPDSRAGIVHFKRKLPQ